MKTIARLAVGIVIAVLLVYAADAVWVRLRMANHQDPTSAIQVRITYAIPQKNGRIAYSKGDTESQSCVRSLFPHLGLDPCWYVERHTTKEIRY